MAKDIQRQNVLWFLVSDIRFGGSPGPQQGLRERIRFAPGAVEADFAEAAMGRFEPIFRACVHVAP